MFSDIVSLLQSRPYAAVPSLMVMASLKDKVVIITGASNGIGKAIALEFAGLGSRLVLTGRNETDLQDTIDKCKKLGLSDSQVQGVNVDFSGDDKGIKNLVDSAIEKFGVIDVLVNNAAIGLFGYLHTQTMEEYDLIMKVNLRSVFYLTKLVRPHIIKQKGNIIMISSLTGSSVLTNSIAYSMSKAALDHMTRNLSMELAAFGVRVNSVSPGAIVTKIRQRLGVTVEQEQKFQREVVPKIHALGRIGQPEEVAKAVRFLASDDASFTTGVTLSVDGGALNMFPLQQPIHD